MAEDPFRKVEVEDEKELEDLIVKNPERLEKDLKVVGRQVRTSHGPLDVLCVDSDGALAVIEIKKDEDEDQLTQALRYYDWVYENRPALAQFYPRAGIQFEKEPRIILVAQGFPEELLINAKYFYKTMKTPDLFRYTCLETKSGERGLVFNSVDIPPPKEPPPRPIKPQELMDQLINWVTDDGVKELLLETIENIKQIGDGVKAYPVKWNIQFKAKTVFASIGTARDHFNIWTTSDWIRTPVYSSKDLTPEFWQNLKTFFVECGGKISETEPGAEEE